MIRNATEALIPNVKISLRWLLIIAACGIRFVGLDVSPPGFYIDEAMGAAHSLCYQQTGRDLFNHVGLFSKIDFGGFQSAPFLMTSAAWTSVFGSSAQSFRSWIALIGVLTIFGIYRVVLNATTDRDKAIWATVFAACLPWAFQFSRISWDAPLATCLLAWALAAIYWRPKKLHRAWALALAGSLFALASYTYAPMRLNSALLLLLLPGLTWREKATALVAFGVLNIPVLPYYADPDFVSRSKLLALTSSYPDNPFHGAGPFGLFEAYLSQVTRHFSFNFLLLHGDANVRHSIQSFGMIDLVTALGCVIAIGFCLVQKRTTLLVRLSLVGLFAGVTPAALTWEGIPHAIRAMGAWPFFCLLAAQGWTFVTLLRPRVRFALVAASALCFALYLESYFATYPKFAGAWFDESSYRQIMQTRLIPVNYGGPVGRAYYRMAVLGERCEDLQKESLQ